MNKYSYTFPSCLRGLTYTLALSCFSLNNYSHAVGTKEIPDLVEPSSVRQNEQHANPERISLSEKRSQSLNEFMELQNLPLETVLEISGIAENEITDAIEACGWENIEEYLIRLNLNDNLLPTETEDSTFQY